MKKDKSILTGITSKQAENITNSISNTLKLEEGTGISINLSRKKVPIPDYVMVMQAVGMVVSKEINTSSLAVLWLFLCKLQYSNHIGVDQKTIAEETGMSLITIKKAIHQLKEKNIILDYKDLQDNRRNVYMINPEVAWRGKATERIKAVRKLEAENKNQLKMFLPE